jgi:hypothetical protein
MGLKTLVDTSSWVEYLRDTGSRVCTTVDRMIRDDERIATTDVVIMELLCGTPTAARKQRIWALMNRCLMLPTRPLFDYELAAELYTRCRQSGFTPASTNDLLVAAVAIGKEMPLLTADSDFGKIASVSSLRLAAV